MSKAVLRSVKPYWIYLILTGKKKVEVGKDSPKSADWNRVVEMYCSKDIHSFNRIPKNDREWMRKYLGKVVCKFVCNKIDKFVIGSLACDDVEEKACLSYKEICDYFYGNNYDNTVRIGYAQYISDLKIYDKPKELSEFKKAGYMPEEQWLYALYPNTHCHYAAWAKKFEITRPPQSWMYVEETNESIE